MEKADLQWHRFSTFKISCKVSWGEGDRPVSVQGGERKLWKESFDIPLVHPVLEWVYRVGSGNCQLRCRPTWEVRGEPAKSTLYLLCEHLFGSAFSAQWQWNSASTMNSPSCTYLRSDSRLQQLVRPKCSRERNVDITPAIIEAHLMCHLLLRNSFALSISSIAAAKCASIFAKRDQNMCVWQINFRIALSMNRTFVIALQTSEF